MKRIICIAVSIVLIGSVYAQEKFSVPVRTCEQKYSRVKSETYGFVSSGINFAKSQGVSPYDYGKYVGTLYAQLWNPEIGFDGFVNSVIRTWESLKTDQDGKIIITEKTDGSVLMEWPKIAMTKYFSEQNQIATFEEVVDYFRGVLNPITDRFNCTASINVTDIYLALNFKKN